MNKASLTDRDLASVVAFTNFLSWGEEPVIAHGPDTRVNPKLGRAVPPAWWAYVVGASSWCPPKGEW